MSPLWYIFTQNVENTRLYLEQKSINQSRNVKHLIEMSLKYTLNIQISLRIPSINLQRMFPFYWYIYVMNFFQVCEDQAFSLIT